MVRCLWTQMHRFGSLLPLSIQPDWVDRCNLTDLDGKDKLTHIDAAMRSWGKASMWESFQCLSLKTVSQNSLMRAEGKQEPDERLSGTGCSSCEVVGRRSLPGRVLRKGLSGAAEKSCRRP